MNPGASLNVNSALQDAFTSNQNVDYILSSVIDQISKLSKYIIKKDQAFFNIFNTVASSIFKVESKNNKDLATINGIVISELTKYIARNPSAVTALQPPPGRVNFSNNAPDPAFVPRVPAGVGGTPVQLLPPIQPVPQFQSVPQSQGVQQSQGVPPNPSIPQFQSVPLFASEPQQESQKEISVKKEKFRINIATDFKPFPLQNVLSVKLVSLWLPNSDYIITEFNNKFIFREQISEAKELYSENFEINIEPGDYTPETLLEDLETSMNSMSKNDTYRCLLDPVTKKTVITSIDLSSVTENTRNIVKFIKNAKDHEGGSGKKFEIISSTLLPCLGFNGNQSNCDKYISQNSIKLLRCPVINLCVMLNKNIKIFDEPLIIGNSDNNIIYFKNNIQKIFNRSIDIEDFTIDFGNYNRRGHDFNLILEIESVAL